LQFLRFKKQAQKYHFFCIRQKNSEINNKSNEKKVELDKEGVGEFRQFFFCEGSYFGCEGSYFWREGLNITQIVVLLQL